LGSGRGCAQGEPLTEPPRAKSAAAVQGPCAQGEAPAETTCSQSISWKKFIVRLLQLSGRVEEDPEVEVVVVNLRYAGEKEREREREKERERENSREVGWAYCNCPEPI